MPGHFLPKVRPGGAAVPPNSLGQNARANQCSHPLGQVALVALALVAWLVGCLGCLGCLVAWLVPWALGFSQNRNERSIPNTASDWPSGRPAVRPLASAWDLQPRPEAGPEPGLLAGQDKTLRARLQSAERHGLAVQRNLAKMDSWAACFLDAEKEEKRETEKKGGHVAIFFRSGTPKNGGSPRIFDIHSHLQEYCKSFETAVTGWTLPQQQAPGHRQTSNLRRKTTCHSRKPIGIQTSNLRREKKSPQSSDLSTNRPTSPSAAPSAAATAAPAPLGFRLGFFRGPWFGMGLHGCPRGKRRGFFLEDDSRSLPIKSKPIYLFRPRQPKRTPMVLWGKLLWINGFRPSTVWCLSLCCAPRFGSLATLARKTGMKTTDIPEAAVRGGCRCGELC